MKMKKLTSLLLSVLMVICLMPAAAFAADAPAGKVYVLMNIPYSEFYKAELPAGANVDAVATATLNGKARNINVNGASYHQSEDAVSKEGIAGVTYPVLVSEADLQALKGTEVKDDALVSYDLNARGQVTKVELKGADALQESPNYSYYKLSAAPANYKEVTVTDGKASFSEVKGTKKSGEATAKVTSGGRHTNIEFTLEGVEVEAANVSGVVVAAGSEAYALHHVVNIWRGTELGWNLSDIDLGGKKIDKITYYLKDGSVTEYKTDINIPKAGFALMNIPYGDFYAAELGEGAAKVDAVSSSTKNKTRTGTLAGGSYHVDKEGTDISGVIYPVFVTDFSLLEKQKEIKDSDKVAISVTNRGNTTETTYEGAKALFEAPSYSYYTLSDAPARYKTLTVDEKGAFSFSAVSGRATTVETAKGEVNEDGHHADVEIKLSDIEGITSDTEVSGVVVTFGDESKVGLRHVTEIWRGTELGGEASMFAGKTIKNVRYITKDSVIDFPMEIVIKNKATAEITASFKDGKTIEVAGLPKDIQNAKATVSSVVPKGQEAVVIAEGAEIKDGVITTKDAASAPTNYNVYVYSDNYLRLATTAKKNFEDLAANAWYNEFVDYVTDNGIMNGISGTEFAPDRALTRGMVVTILYRAEGSPEIEKAASFTDNTIDWAKDAVSWASANGIVNGYEDNTFKPNQDVTRQELAAMLARYAGFKGADVSKKADLGKFTDEKAIADWARNNVAWAVNAGLINGMGDGTVAPGSTATRAQMAKMIKVLQTEVLAQADKAK